jgi:mono/diheme cytochrome c family protein
MNDEEDHAMKTTGSVLAGMLLLGISGVVGGQSAAAVQEKNPKKKPVTHREPESGAQLYKNYCAACHGIEGKGDGPVVRFLKLPPADLSTLAQRNNGKYPTDRVAATLHSGTDSGAHGTSDMPIWGPVFKSQGKGVAQMRIQKLTEFIESLQQK